MKYSEYRHFSRNLLDRRLENMPDNRFRKCIFSNLFHWLWYLEKECPRFFGRRISLNHPPGDSSRRGLRGGGGTGAVLHPVMKVVWRVQGARKGEQIWHPHLFGNGKLQSMDWLWVHQGLWDGMARDMGGLLLEKVSKVRGMRPHQGISLGLE